MAGLALVDFEAQAEAYAQARGWREYQFLSGRRPGRGLVGLYAEDFPSFTSTDLWADVQAATPEDPRQQARLSALLASAYLEGRTREFASRLTRAEASATLSFEESEVLWRQAPARWAVIGETPRRHELQEAWRGVFRAELNPSLERWQEALQQQLRTLGTDNWLEFWSNLRGLDSGEVSKLAGSVFDRTAEMYGNGLGVYLSQLELPIDDVWTSDIDWAFRAPRFDAQFIERLRQPTLVRALRDLGIELEEQANVRLEYGVDAELNVVPVSVPNEVQVLWRPVGGWTDYARALRGLGMAEHLAHADPSLRVWERWLGDETPTHAYGFLMEGLLRDRAWLAQRMDFAASDDFRVIAHLAWLYRLRSLAARTTYEQRLWQGEPGLSLAADFEEALSAATRVRHFQDEYLRVALHVPWTSLESAVLLRAETFAAQLRHYLRGEFDEEWWRSGRAAHFIKDELWRPGRRHSAEELLGFMGYEAFDVAVLVSEFEEVLQPL